LMQLDILQLRGYNDGFCFNHIPIKRQKWRLFILTFHVGWCEPGRDTFASPYRLLKYP
jgi:hypothetical protein